MTNYAELVKNLRITERICRDRMDGQVMLDAADAIEELEKKMLNWQATADDHWEAYQHWFHKYMDDMPKWIPVTERLPDKPGEYLVCRTFDYGYGVNQSIDVESYSLDLNKVDEYDFHGKEYKRPGWFDYDSEYGHYETGREITHWMPLPTPPKEETE